MQKNISSKVAQNAVECDNAIELRLNCQLIDASQLFASNVFPQLSRLRQRLNRGLWQRSLTAFGRLSLILCSFEYICAGHASTMPHRSFLHISDIDCSLGIILL